MEEQVVLSSAELQKVVKQAKDLAAEHKKPLTSLYILGAMAQVRLSYSYPVLSRLGIKLEGKNSLSETAAKMKAEQKKQRLTEPETTLKSMHATGCELMAQHRSGQLNTLLYLLALCRLRESLAFQVLRASGIDVTALRTEILRTLQSVARLGQAEEETTRPPTSSGRAAGTAPAGGRGPEVVRSPTARGQAAGTAPAGGAGPEVVRPTTARGRVAPDRSGVVESSEPESAAEFPEYTLDPEEFPLLASITRNLTLEAAQGRIDPVIGRRHEIEQMIQILCKRRTNNPCLVGDPGVGKTALVEGLALETVNKASEARRLEGRTILALETSSLVAGTQLRGSFSEKMIQLREEVKKASGKVIIFIDEIHTIVGAGGGETALDAANELKTSLARGEFPCIGATTPGEYEEYIAKDPALARRFKKVYVAEPGMEETRSIAQGIIGFYEKHHSVKYSARALDTAVRLSGRYITDRAFPDKAIELLDTAGSRASGLGRSEVLEEDVAHVLAGDLGIPLERLLLHSDGRFHDMEEHMSAEVVGHKENSLRACEAVRRGIAGFSSNRPLASLLFVGPPGVGKTQTAMSLARFLFDRDDSLLTFQMSEFTEKHSIAKLIGTAPGYVGHQEGGRLTEAIGRRGFRIILFREFLSAHEDIQELIAELVRTGTLTDGKGRKAYFSNAVVVLSQDVEAELLSPGASRKQVGFSVEQRSSDRTDPEAVLKEMRRRCPSSLFDVVDERLVFMPLTDSEVAAVARMEARSASARLKEERDVSFELTDTAVEFLIRSGGFTAKGGARLMRQTLARTVESFLADRLLDRSIVSGNHIVVDCSGTELHFDVR